MAYSVNSNREFPTRTDHLMVRLLLSAFTLFWSCQAASQPAPNSILALEGYELAGFLSDQEAVKQIQAVSTIASTFESKVQREILLLVFVGESILDHGRISMSALTAFPENQSNNLRQIVVDQDECNLASLDSGSNLRVFLLVSDSRFVSNDDLKRCIAEMFAVSIGVSKDEMADMPTRSLVTKFFEGYWNDRHQY